MEFLTGWITNIIILVLLAGVIELLLPGNQFQSYIKMVLGLLILLAMLTPIFKLIGTDFGQLAESMNLPTSANEEKIKKSIEANKSEIQDNQRAYILKQMAVPMKKQVQEELNQTYELEIVELQIQTNKSKSSLNPEDITGVKVVLAPYQDQKSVSEVSEVSVEVSKSGISTVDNSVPDGVRQYLASQWQLDDQQVEVEMEGGEE